ncbi:MAG TPA: hypothetical protein VFX17_03650, partial [Patescibacteria group bacterium]|nr:hypothetical protein [Patescibacteria group bacterium]
KRRDILYAAADHAADLAADLAADSAADLAADSAADHAADLAADSAADLAADSAADLAADSAADLAADHAACLTSLPETTRSQSLAVFKTALTTALSSLTYFNFTTSRNVPAINLAAIKDKSAPGLIAFINSLGQRTALSCGIASNK